MKAYGICKYTVRNYVNSFVERNVCKQGSHIKASHNHTAGVEVEIKQFLNERKGIPHHVRPNGKRIEKWNKELSYFISIIIDT